MDFLAAALEIADLAEHSGQPLDRAARVYYGVGARFALDEMRAAARRLPAETPWQKQAVEATIDDFFALQADLAAPHSGERIAHASRIRLPPGRRPHAALSPGRAADPRAPRCGDAGSRNARRRRPPAPPRADQASYRLGLDAG